MSGVDRIAAERLRQVAKCGYSPAHDAQHSGGELVQAAAAYGIAHWTPDAHECWPFADGFKPDQSAWPANAIRNLERAGALIAAEIDRLEIIAGAQSSADERQIALPFPELPA